MALAEAGQVDVEWLIGVAKNRLWSLDVALLRQSIEGAEEGFAELELEGLSARTKAFIIADIYETYGRSQRKPERDMVIEIIKLSAGRKGKRKNQQSKLG